MTRRKRSRSTPRWSTTTRGPTSPQQSGKAPVAPPVQARRIMANPPHNLPDDAPVFVISVAAQLAGMHAQTLRQYDRLGLVRPRRRGGGGGGLSPRGGGRVGA